MAVNVEPNFIELDEVVTQATPATSKVRLYPKAGGALYSLDDLGVETQLGGGGGSVDNGICDGRLTPTTNTPVTSSDSLAVTSVYFTPYMGNRVALYNGSTWAISTFTERTLSLSGLSINTNYNIYLYDNAGTLTLEASATATTLQDGVKVKTGSLTYRYLGIVRITGTTGQTEDSTAKRYIANEYNQVSRKLVRRDGTNSWTYATANTFRPYNNDSTNNRVEFVISNVDNAVRFQAHGALNTAGNVGVGGSVGIGIDSTSTDSSDVNSGYIGQVATLIVPISAIYTGNVTAGHHVIYPLEAITTAVSMTFYGDNGSTIWKTGLVGEVYG